MTRFYIIGEASVDFAIGTDGTTAAMTAGGVFLKTACSLGSAGEPVTFVGEIGLDPMGRIIDRTLRSSGVDTSCCDFFDGAKTPVRIFDGDNVERYDDWNDSQDRLDVAWPRFTDQDVLLFGGYLALDPRVRKPLTAILDNARQFGARIIYAPSLSDTRISRITKYMPMVYENMEYASLITALPDDLKILFGTDDPDRAYRMNVCYYCPDMVAVDGDKRHGFSATAYGNASEVSDYPSLPKLLSAVMAEYSKR